MTEFNSDSTETHRGGAPPTPVRGPVIHQPPADPEPVISLPARPLPRVEETGSNHLWRLNVGVGTVLLLVFGAAFAVGVSGTVQRDDIRVLGTSQTAPTTSTALNGEIAAGSPGADGSVIGAGDDESATPSSSQIAALPVATAPGPPTSPVTAPAGTSSVATSQEATTAPTTAAPTTAPETTAAAPTTTVATTVRPTTTVATTARPTTTTTTTTQPTTTTTTEPTTTTTTTEPTTTTSTTSTTTTQPTTTTTTEPTTTTTSSTTTADDGPGNGGGNGRGNNGNGKGNGGPRP